jgi:hypothetical protein
MGNIMRTTICWFLGILRRGTAAGSKSANPEKQRQIAAPSAGEDLLGFGQAGGVGSTARARQWDACVGGSEITAVRGGCKGGFVAFRAFARALGFGADSSVRWREPLWLSSGHGQKLARRVYVALADSTREPSEGHAPGGMYLLRTLRSPCTPRPADPACQHRGGRLMRTRREPVTYHPGG